MGGGEPPVPLGVLFGLFPGGLAPAVSVGVEFHREATVRLLDLRFGGPTLHSEQGVVVAHSSSSASRRLVWSTRATILSYGIRVGPSTPMTPANGPERYGAVTSVKGARCGLWCSPPIVTVRPAPRGSAPACRSRSRRSGTASSPCRRSAVAGSGGPAGRCVPARAPPLLGSGAGGPSTTSPASGLRRWAA